MSEKNKFNTSSNEVNKDKFLQDRIVVSEERDPEIDLSKGVMGKYSFVNINYQMLKKVSQVGESEKWVILKLFKKSKLAMFGLIVIATILILSLIIPFFAKDPSIVNASEKDYHRPPFSDGAIFGTDYLGRDVFSRVWYGIRFSFGMAAMVVLVDLIVGYVLGILMGTYRWVDRVGQFIIKILINVPTVIILVLLTLVLRPSFWTIILGVTITGWIGMANQIRAQVIKTRQQDWVVASRTLGTSNLVISFRKLTPHLIPLIVIQLVLSINSALVADLTLSVLGLAIPNIATVGSLLMASQRFVLIYPIEILFPVLTITVILTSVQFIGLGLQGAVNGRV